MPGLAIEKLSFGPGGYTFRIDKRHYFCHLTFAPTCSNDVKRTTNIGTLKTSNNKVAWLINSFSGFMLSFKTTIFQISNFLLHLAVVITLNHYTEDDTLTLTLQQVLCFVWKTCKCFQGQVLTPCLMAPFLKFTVCFLLMNLFSL